MAATGGKPVVVSSPTMTNADQLKRETKKTDLTAHSGIIYQAKTTPDHPEDNGKISHHPGWFGSPERRKQQDSVKLIKSTITTLTSLTLTAARQSV